MYVGEGEEEGGDRYFAGWSRGRGRAVLVRAGLFAGAVPAPVPRSAEQPQTRREDTAHLAIVRYRRDAEEGWGEEEGEEMKMEMEVKLKPPTEKYPYSRSTPPGHGWGFRQPGDT